MGDETSWQPELKRDLGRPRRATALISATSDSRRPTSDSPLVQMRDITKRFGPVLANDRVSLDLWPGEIHAILGENGAGKTTLMNILSGMETPDSGTIRLDGVEVQIAAPADALRLGIGTVYQHFTLVPNLSILENVVLGAARGFVLDLADARVKVAAMLADFGLDVSPDAEIRHLALGQRQRVEIIKALFRGSRILLLDEPTSILTPGEVAALLDLLRRLRNQGVAVVLITHKLGEALAVSDRVTILRGGHNAGEFGPDALAEASRESVRHRIVEQMFGAPHVAPHPHAVLGSTGEALLSLQHISTAGAPGAPPLRDLSLELRRGEVVGIAGVDGNGQKELGEVIAGQRPITSGQIFLNGENITNHGVAAATRAGIAYVTDDRLQEGTVAALSVAENVALKAIGHRPFSNGFWLNRRAMEEEARRAIAEFDVKTPGPDTPIGLLSGGNIQKLLLARELALDPLVLVCNKPTHGLDLRTAEFVVHILREQADAGKAVLLISSELDELLEISDRIGVMVDGEMVAVIPRAEASLETIGDMMLGGRRRARQAAR